MLMGVCSVSWVMMGGVLVLSDVLKLMNPTKKMTVGSNPNNI